MAFSQFKKCFSFLNPKKKKPNESGLNPDLTDSTGAPLDCNSSSCDDILVDEPEPSYLSGELDPIDNAPESTAVFDPDIWKRPNFKVNVRYTDVDDREDELALLDTSTLADEDIEIDNNSAISYYDDDSTLDEDLNFGDSDGELESLDEHSDDEEDGLSSDPKDRPTPKTPRNCGAICRIVHDNNPFKDGHYNRIVNKKMDPRYTEIQPDKFRHKFFQGMRPILKTKRAKVHTLEPLRQLLSKSKPTDEQQTKTKLEKAMYPLLVDTFQSIFELANSKAQWKIVANHPETGKDDIKIDLALYPDDDRAKEAYTHNFSEARLDAEPALARCAWAHMLSAVEVKPCHSESGYTWSTSSKDDDDSGASKPPSFLNNTPTGRTARAQHAKYAAQIMLRQHRTHVFTIYVSAGLARVYRWDRAGCVATEPIDLLDDPWDFFDILYCMARQKAPEWGYDDTAVLASQKEIDKFREHDPGNDYLRAYKDAIFENELFYPIYKVECPEVNMDEEAQGKSTTIKSFLIGRHISGHGMPVGRCTRGYIAFDTGAQKMCFLKDQWRAQVRTPELEVYARLHRHKVQCIVTPIAGGDIPGKLRTSFQTTRYQDHIRASARMRRSLVRVHTRLVTKEIGRPLDTYKNGYELLSVIALAIVAHRQAWEKAEVLHRDVSAGNIMIDVHTGKGFLNDWDLAKYKEDLGSGAPASEAGGISGTWPFLSATALQYPTKPAEVSDDLESFIYVVLWLAFRFHRHADSPKAPACATEAEQLNANKMNFDLAKQIDGLFYDERTLENGVTIGGRAKLKDINLGVPPIELKKQKTPIAVFLKEAYALLHEHYRAIDFKRLQPYAGEPQLSTSTQDDQSRSQGAAEPYDLDPCDEFLDEFSSPKQKPKSAERSPSRRTSSGSNAPQRLLDDHSDLFHVIHKVLREVRAGKLDDDDYLFDQFAKLGELQKSTPKNSTGGTSKLSGSKRSSADANEGTAADQEKAGSASARPSKKLKKK
ncbi:hypothetical protein PsYK624_026390 [Phanerochaete sordida]|uniref:Fungal-type protein kinase domain-containing protein n=1 Tax=Phanerochaete sordida TaxID=48140 RepID=A0A9P3L9I3_9APHY|nr:hypothetical protein PsYK624_026390 [Phanerochaete sordida]